MGPKLLQQNCPYVMLVMQRLPRLQNGLSRMRRVASDAGDGGRSQNQQVRYLCKHLHCWSIHDRHVTEGEGQRWCFHKRWSERKGCFVRGHHNTMTAGGSDPVEFSTAAPQQGSVEWVTNTIFPNTLHHNKTVTQSIICKSDNLVYYGSQRNV